MAVSVMKRCLAVLWGVLTVVLAVTGTDAQPTMTVTMRLAEAEWHVVRQEVLPRFEAVCNCRVRAIDVPPETLLQRLRAMRQAGRMEIDLFAQDNMRLQELIDTALAAPFTPEEGQVEEAIYPSLMAVGVSGGVRYFLPFRPNVQIAYYLVCLSWCKSIARRPSAPTAAGLAQYVRPTSLVEMSWAFRGERHIVSWHWP